MRRITEDARTVMERLPKPLLADGGWLKARLGGCSDDKSSWGRRLEERPMTGVES